MILKYTLGHYPVHHGIKVNPRLISKDQECLNQEKVQEYVNSIEQIKKEWSQFGYENNGTDAASLASYYSLISIIKIPSARNILQIGCGTGNLIPIALMLKPEQTTYLATDLTQTMIQSTKNNLKANFDKYQSKLTFNEWCQKQNLIFKVANGEQIIEPHTKFDRIICNCVLMITSNPLKMLHSLFKQAENGCLLGISIWGDKQKNPMLKFITQMLKQYNTKEKGLCLRDQFHLYKKVNQIASKVGWRLVMRWEQNSIVPILNINNGKNNQFERTLKFFINYLPKNKRQQGEIKIRQKAREMFQSKQGINFSTQIYIFEKP